MLSNSTIIIYLMEDLRSFVSFLPTFDFKDYCGVTGMQYAFVWSLIVATLCFVLGKITREYSWVDRLWPLLPIGYGFHYLNHQEECGKVPIALRQKIMLGMMILWGCKHTFNFGRKGGFKRGG